MKKFEELIEPGCVLLAIAEVMPELVEQISPYNLRRIEKRALNHITTRQKEAIQVELLNDGGIQFNRMLTIFTSESTTRTTEKGKPKRKVSVRTRERMNRLYNQ